MGCACNGGAAAAHLYEAVAPDGTVIPISATRTRGTVGEARTAAASVGGGWVRKA